MIRGTFANIRLRNQLVPGVEGGVTRHLPDGEQQSIFDAATAYARDGVPLIVLAGADYGSGSSRDWAAKGTLLLGVKAVLATSFERIHRANLIGMGVLPLQFMPGQSAQSLGLTGEEIYSITGLAGVDPLPRQVTVRIDADGRAPEPRQPSHTEFTATVRIDTPAEAALLPPRRDPALRPSPAAARRRTRGEGGVRCRTWPSTDWAASAGRR